MLHCASTSLTNNNLFVSLWCSCLRVTELFAGTIQGQLGPKPSLPGTHRDSDRHDDSANFPTIAPGDHFSGTARAISNIRCLRS